MKRRAFLSKIALFAAIAPIALAASVVEAEKSPTSWIDRIELEPSKITEGVSPEPYATVRVNSPFNELPYVPYKVVVGYPNSPSAYDPLGQRGYVGYKYIMNGEMYGNFLVMDESYMNYMTDYDFNSLGTQLCATEVRGHGCKLPMILSNNFTDYIRD